MSTQTFVYALHIATTPSSLKTLLETGRPLAFNPKE
jgi:hypothetical protein